METQTKTPDNDRIDRLIDWAEASALAGDDAWDQRQWARKTACGTAYCIAGKVAEEEGAEFVWHRLGHNFRTAMSVIPPNSVDGAKISISDFASETLGLNVAEADVLFKGTNDIADLRRAARRIRDGRYYRSPRLFVTGGRLRWGPIHEETANTNVDV